MFAEVPFEIQLDGGDASHHLLPAYDGYTALAGFSLSLSLITNYVETGTIRRRGEFVGRSAVKAYAISEGSVLSKFKVYLESIGGFAGLNLSPSDATALLHDTVKRTIDRNLGIEPNPQTNSLKYLERTRGGDLEALVAATEPSIRQAHSVIGDGARVMNIFGGSHQIGSFDIGTKQYVEGFYFDNTIRQRDFSVASFNANSGHGGVFDNDLGRVVPFAMKTEVLRKVRPVFSWGLDQYANGTGEKISVKYTTVLALDDTVKKYQVIGATRPNN